MDQQTTLVSNNGYDKSDNVDNVDVTCQYLNLSIYCVFYK